jgi:hypothetical protein
MRKINLWLDDVRLPPDEFQAWCTNTKDMKKFLTDYWGHIEVISLDHDLGDEDYGTGYDVITFIEELVHVHGWEPHMEFRIHSDNPVGRKNMLAGIASIKRNNTADRSGI